MTIGAGNIIALSIVATAVSGCQLRQGPLLSAPSGTDDLATRHNKAGIQGYKQEQWNRAREQFEAADTIAPSLAESHSSLGMEIQRWADHTMMKR